MKRTIAILALSLMTLCIVLSVSVFAEEDVASGVRLSNTDYYQSIDALSDLPLTFEALIKVSADMPDGAKGPIAGNYNGGIGTHDVINFEIAEMGVPKVYIRPYDDEAGAYLDAIQIYFPGKYNSSTASFENPIDLRTGELTHLAITLDPANGKAYCYINGEMSLEYSGEYYYYSSGAYKKSWKTYDLSPIASMDKMENVAIGRDKRTGSGLSYLNGEYAEIYSVAMYSELLSDEVINKHVSGFGNEGALIAAYDLTKDGYTRLKDYSTNGNHLYYTDTSGVLPMEFYKDPGFAPESTDYYQSVDYLESFPYTFETWINVSESAPDTFKGAIAGNYDASAGDAVVFSVAELGTPRVYLKPYNESSGTYGSGIDIYFPEVDIRLGTPTHLAIAIDPDQNKAYCYVNGELRSTYSGQKYYYNSSTNAYGQYSGTVSISVVSELDQLSNMAIGRDHRGGSYLFALDGSYAEIYSVAMYSETLSAQRIASDVMSVEYNDAALLVSYDMTLAGRERLKDSSANRNHLFYSSSLGTGYTEWYESSEDGFEFSPDELYRNDTAPYEMPHTFEAEVYFPIADKVNYAGGVLIGNRGFDKGGISLEIGGGGTVVFTSEDQNGIVSEFVFDSVCVYNNAKTHVAVTVDEENETISCYIDGELKQSFDFCGILYKSYHIAYAVGGDYRTGNKYCFGGKIISCALYSDVRSAEEISEDVTSTDKESLIFSYGYDDTVNSGLYPDRIRDMSDNRNDALVPKYLIGEAPDSDFESSYSFAVIGDTQSLIYNYPDKLAGIYDWILANAESKNIKFVMGLGDITEKNTDAEWALAKKEITKLQGVIPYSLAVGNHDTAKKLTATFEGTGYREQLSGSFGDGLENTYSEITVGEVSYLIFSLDCGASDEVLGWAGEIIALHPHHNVIITTHAYLFRDGTTLDANDRGNLTDWGYENNGDGIWDKLVSKYANIVLVLSGHITSDEIVMSKRVGDHGNIVTELLINPQDVDAKQFPAGLVATLNFSEDGSRVRVEYYATAQGQYFMEKNQFETSVDTAQTEPPASSIVPKMNITLDANLVFNIYVPEASNLISFEVDGIKYTELSALSKRIIDGKSYYSVSVPLAAKDAARDIKLTVTVDNGGAAMVGSFTLNIVKYSKKIIEGSDEAEKTLIMDVLAYIRAAYAYFKSEDVAQIDDILGDYSRALVAEGSAEAPSVTGLSAATFVLEAEPAVIFYLENGYRAENYVFMQGGRVLEPIEYGDGGSYVKIKLYAYLMCEEIEIVYADERDSYHINSYYEFAKNENDDGLVAAVEAFWNYCLSARDYRAQIIEREAGK